MTVAEVVRTLLELDQESECLFVKRGDSPYVYLIASLPDGQRVGCEMPTGIEKSKLGEQN